MNRIQALQKENKEFQQKLIGSAEEIKHRTQENDKIQKEYTELLSELQEIKKHNNEVQIMELEKDKMMNNHLTEINSYK